MISLTVNGRRQQFEGNGAMRRRIRWAAAYISVGFLASCVAGSEGPHGPGNPPADPEPGRADLVAGPIQVPDHVRVDSILEMVVDVRNRGTKGVDPGWIVRVMLSTDRVIDSADIQVDHFSAPRHLPAGAEDQYLRHKKLRGSTPLGSYYIGSILDVTGRVDEASETNNILASPATITLTEEVIAPPDNGD
jgi:hypothetical protein